MKLSFYKISVFVFGVALSLLCENSPSSAQQAANTLPTGGTVTSGSANIAQNNNTMNINQSSQKAIINWSTFNVGSAATVNFNQPNSQSSTLNRVNSASKSMIDGAVNANGTVIFVNPNGIVFGKGAEVHTGSIVATTMNIADQEYLSENNKKIFEGSANGKIVNKGTITASNIDGYIALMAPQVKNQGVVIANMSGNNSIALVSGEKVTLTFQGEQLLNVNVDASTIKSLIKNKNLIQTNSGQVIIAANAASDLKSSVLVNTGTISADGLNVKGGKVYLTASTIKQQGTVTASATSNSSGKRVEGGMIVALANTIKLASGSKTLATGDNGGGVITLSAAKKVNVKAGALVDASANTSGNGGSINIDAPTVKVNGKLLANGGNQYGNGGSINIITSNFVTSASAIIKAGSQVANGVAGNLSFSMPTININQVFANLISSALNSTNVILNALKNVYFTLANSATNNAAIINLLQGVVIHKTISTRTGLQLNADGTVYLAGQVVANEGSLLDLVLNGNNAVSISELAKLVTSSVVINSKQGEVNLTGASLTSTGGNINILAKGDINVVNLNFVANNPIDGGQIAMISTDGSVNLQQSFIQTNGGMGRGGTISITANQDVAVLNTNVLANGGTDGGQVVIISGGKDVNLSQTLIQTNGSTGRGGTILISGANQTLISGTEINATGYTHGGTIKIGNDDTNHTLPFSNYTSIDETSSLNVSQQDNSPSNFNGGTIETSGGTLNLLLKITTGQGGLWLLDPTTVTITSSGKTSNGNIDNALTQSGSVNIRDADIVSALNAGTNVVITATTSITNTVGQIGWGSNPVSGGSGDLTFTAPTINIANSITTRGAQTYNGAVNLTNSGSSSVDVVFTSNSSITFNSTVNDNGTGHGFKVVGTVVTFKENVGSTTKPNAINITASNRAYVYGNITANSINFNNLSVYATPSSVFSPTSIGTSLLYRNLYITLGIEASAVYKSSTTLNSFTSYTLTGLRASDSAITLSSITVNNGDAGSTYVTAFTLSANTSTYILGTTGQANIVTGQKTTNTVNIAKATLTISAITAQNKVYDTTNAATISAYTSNILGSDQITFTSTATFASANAGTGITVTASNITIGGTDSANYTLATTSRTTTANITKANLTATGSQVYNSSTSFLPSNLTIVGVNGQTFTATGTATLTSANVQTNQPLSSVSLTLTGVSGALTSNYNTLTASQTSVSITPALVNIIGVDNSTVYNGSLQTNTGAKVSINGGSATTINGSTVSTGIGSQSFNLSGYANGTNAGSYDDALVLTPVSGTSASNYLISYNQGSLVINPKALTIGTTTVNNKVYDGGTSASVNTLGTLSGLVGKESVSVATSTASFATSNVGTGLSVTVSYTLANGAGAKGGFASNYTLANTTTTANITAKALTISGLTVTDKVYDGGTTANLNKSSATLVGLISGDVVSLSATNASGTYVSANAANGITVSVTGNTISGTDSANYTLSQPTLTGNITPALITITGANNTLTYNASIQTNSGAKVSINGGIATTISGSTINTGIGTESFTLTGYAAAKDYSATRYNDSLLLTSGTGTVAGNYSITYSQGGLTINKAPLTVTGVTTSVTYNGGAQTNNAATITGKQGSDSIVVAGYASATNVGNYSDNLSVTSSVASNYNITYVNGSLTINTKALTIVANAQSTPYGTVVTTGAGATQFTTVGLVSSDVVNSVTLSTNQLVTTNAGASGIIATPSAALGSGLSNYSITYNTGVVTVTPKALTITANAQSTTYGTGLTLGTSGYTVSGLINSDQVTAVTLLSNSSATISATTNAGTYNIIPSAASGSGLSNYNVSYVNGTLTVNKATLTVTANNQSRIYGDANPALTYAITGYVNGENSTLLTGAPAISTTATTTSNVGSYIITSAANSLSAANYQFNYVNGSLAITKATLTVTANNQSRIYGDNNPTLTYTITGYKNSDSSSVVTGTPNISTTATTTSNVGSYTITSAANNLNANNYNFTYAPGTLTVNKATLTVTANNQSRVYGDANPTLTYAITGYKNSDTSSVVTGTPNISTTATTTSNVGSYKITSAVNSLSASNYQFNYVNGSLAITKAPLIVTGVTTSVTYNGSTQTNGNATITGNKGSDTFTILGYATGTNATTYSDNLSVTSSALGNYNVSYVNGSLVINKASLTVTGVTTSVTYSATAQTNNAATITGNQGSDTFTILGYARATNVGNYVDTLSVTSSALGNYNVSYVNGSLTITKATLIVTGSTTNVTYNGLTQTNNNATIAGNKGSDTFNISGYATGLNTGTYSEILSVSSSALTNYNVTINNGSLVIGKATLTISAVADTKTYDGTRTSNVVPTFTGLVSADTGKLTGLAQAFDSVNVNGVNGSILSVSNYSLNSNNYNVITHTATGTINQLAEVTYTGVSGGNWSDPANWGSGLTAGAIPTLNNVATVIIPSGKTVIYNKDQPNSLTTTSNVSNNGTIKFVTTIDLDYSGIISGGSVFKQGSGIFKLSSKYNKIDFINFSENFTINSSCSNNDCGTYGNISGTGNLTIINGGIFLGNIYLTGNLTLGKNDGTSLENQLITFGTRNYPNIVTVTGDINAYASLNLASTITSGRDQTYNAPITLIRDTVITSTNGSITFKNTIDSDDPKDTKYFKADAYVDLNLEGKIGSINPLWSMDAVTQTGNLNIGRSNEDILIRVSTDTNNSIYFNAGNAYVAQGTNPDPVNGWGSNANIRIFGKVTSVPDDGLDNSGATNRSENFILGAYVDKDGYVQNPTSKMLHPIQLFTGSVYSSYRLSEGYIGGIDYSSTSLTGSGLCTTGALVECGSGRFRYNVDQKTPGYANMKGSGNLKNGINILYREQPQISASIQAVPNPLTYGDILSSVSVVRFNSSIAGYVNGDGLNSNFGEISYDSITLIKGSLSETIQLNKYYDAGTYTLSASGSTIVGSSAEKLGYKVISSSNSTGTLTINPAPLTITANPQTTTYGTSLALGTSAYSIKSGSLATANGDAISSVTLQYNGSATVPSTINAGTYNSVIEASSATGLGGFNGTNYNITYTAGRLIVNKATLTLDLTATYAGIKTVTPTVTSISGVNGQTVSFASINVADQNVNNNSNYVVSLNSPIVTGGTGNKYFSNYTINSGYDASKNKVTLTSATLTYTANPSTDNIYGSTPTINGGSISGYVGSDNVDSTTRAAATIGTVTWTTSATSISDVGSYPINGGNLIAVNNNYTFAQASSNTTALTISPLALTVSSITIEDKNYDGTKIARISGSPVISGVLASDKEVSINVGLVTAEFTTANAGDSIPINLFGVELTGPGSGNYTLVGISGARGKINPAPLNVSFSKNYDGVAIFTSTNSYSISGTLYNGVSTPTISSGTLTVTSANANSTAYSNANSGISSNTLALSDTNYSVTVVGASVSATISPKPITIINNKVSPTYDGATTYAGLISPTAFTLSTPLVGSDNISGVTQAFTVSSSPVSGVAQAGTFVATPSNAILSTGTAGNYIFSYTASTNTVAKANLVITETPSTSGNTYNGNSYTGTYTTTFLGTDASNVTITGAATGTNAGIYSSKLEVTGDPLSNYNTPVITNADLVIDPKPITISKITANGKIYDGTKSVTLNKPNVIDLGFFTRDNILITTTGAFNDENAGTRTVALTQSYSGTISNYTITNQSAEPTAVISARPITVTAENKTKVYGDSTPALTYRVASDAGTESSTSRGLAPKDSLATVFTGGPGTSDTILTGVGNVDITIGTLSANSNYTIAEFNKGSLSITARPITVTADNKTKVYGDSNPDLTYTVASDAGSGSLTSRGLVNRDTLSGSLTTNADEKTPVTLSPVNITKGTLAASNNYDLKFINGALSITQRPITITAADKTKVYGDSIPPLTYTVASDAGSGSSTSRGLVNGDTLSGSITVDATSSTGAGNVNITQGELTSNPNYIIAAFNNGRLTITPRPITISANDRSATYGTSLALGTSAYSIKSGSLATANGDAISSVTLQYNGSATVPSTINAGTYNSVIEASSATGSGGFNSANYNITYTSGSLTVNTKALTITAEAQPTVYGTVISTGTGKTSFKSNGLINGDTVNSVTLATNQEVTTAAGASGITITPSGALGTGLSNYIIEYVSGTVTVNKKAIIASVSAVDKVYNGDTAASIALTYSGLVGSETLTTTSSTATFSDKNVGTGKTVTVNSITLADGANGGLASNYSITTGQTTTANITVKSITVEGVTILNKVYDGNRSAVVSGSAGATFTGTVSGDKLEVVNTGITAVFNDKNVGDGKSVTLSGITVSGADANNYVVSAGTAKANITAKEVILRASKAYDGTTSLTGYVTVTTGVGSETLTYTGATSNDGNVITENKYINAITLADGSGSNGGVATNYKLPTLNNRNAPVTITPKALTATATAQNKTYDGSRAASATLSFSGLVGTETLGQTVEGTFDTKDVGSSKTVTINSITLLNGSKGGFASNYSISSGQTTTAEITTKVLTATATASNKTYDGSETASAILSFSGLVGDETLGQTINATFNSKNVGDGKLVTINSITLLDGLKGGFASNYSILPEQKTTANITPAPLTIKASDDAKFVTETDTQNYKGATYLGFKGSDTSSSGALTGSLKITRNNSDDAAGTYVLTPSGYEALNGNYEITYQTGKFTIVPANTLLVAVNNNKVNYSDTINYTLTARYLSSGNKTIVTLSNVTITNNSVVANDGAGGAVSFDIVASSATKSGSGNVKVGAYDLVASNVEITGNNFNNPMVVTGTLTVEPKIISTDNIVSKVSKIYDGNTNITRSNATVTPPENAIVAKDSVTVYAIGSFTDANVNVNKKITLNAFIEGADASNYALTSSSITKDIGEIKQLSSVNYVGASGGNWSSRSNWNNGAIPVNGNVAQVVIPVGVTVVYDYENLSGTIVSNGTYTIKEDGSDRVVKGYDGTINKLPTSTILNNGGILNILVNVNITFSNSVSGTGSVSLSGTGVVTIDTANTYSGETNINSSKLIIGNANAIGSGAITSSNGTLQVTTTDLLSSLTVNGPVKLASDIKTTGAQTYNGGVILDAGYAVGTSQVITPMTISTVNGDITFEGTLAAGNNALSTKQSLNLNAGGTASKITFNDTVGSLLTQNNGTYRDYLLNPGTASIYNLNVTGAQIAINANITTFATQEYRGAVTIGDNKTNGTVRTILAEYTDSPRITFFGTIDDSAANTHDLIVKAVSLNKTGSQVTFEGAIGSKTPLKSLTVALGSQNSDLSSKYSDIKPNEYLDGVVINANITTYDNQDYFTKSEITVTTTLKCINAGCSINFTKNSADPGSGEPKKYRPPGDGVIDTTPALKSAVYETTDLERFSSRVISDLLDRSDEKISTGGSVNVIFCGEDEDFMNRVRQRCDNDI